MSALDRYTFLLRINSVSIITTAAVVITREFWKRMYSVID